MSSAGRLEDRELSELLRSLAREQASGRLTLTRGDAQAMLALRGGRIVYAASDAMPESFGHLLVRHGLVSEAGLMEALEQQHGAEQPGRLGDLLVAMGKLDRKALQEVIRQRIEGVIAELVRWRTGFFQFERTAVGPGGEVEVDVRDFLLVEGLGPLELLGDTTPPAPAPAGPGGTASVPATLGDVVPALPASVVTTEAALRIMRFAAQIVNRGVLFEARPDELRGIGQFGVRVPGRSAPELVRATVVPLGEPSVLRDVVERRATWRGRLDDSRWNRHLVERLGGQPPDEAVVVPMIVAGTVVALFYGDNLPEHRPIGPVDSLEFLIADAAAALERALAGSRERGPDTIPPRSLDDS